MSDLNRQHSSIVREWDEVDGLKTVLRSNYDDGSVIFLCIENRPGNTYDEIMQITQGEEFAGRCGAVVHRALQIASDARRSAQAGT
ncbi:hypothetical protein [Methylobacterium organophilum]|uniref:Uncharacterized protein n=1 Tax=Methylobacterium organophilum TaxID=410 RepID=A0ABQ4TE19_METOR|nr:hypothetical protein [Methylobacterium organophilum]GJE29533.1 hypothetical protein LKMONMHP_4415 [Methylobacterium organophilum]